MDMSKIYLKENVGRDYTHAMEMFVKVVGQFKTTKKLDATAINQLSDIVRYVAKFTEEFSISTGLTEFKTAKDQLTKAMSLLDTGYEKMAKKNAKKEPEEVPAMDTEEPKTDDMETDKSLDNDKLGDEGEENSDISGKDTDLDKLGDEEDLGNEEDLNTQEPEKSAMSNIKDNDKNIENKYM